MLQEIQFNTVILSRFAALRRKKRLAHAYLFAGPSGIGKAGTAVAIAKLMNCEAGREEMFCGACAACIKIHSGSHPDVYVIDNEDNESIKIEQVRELLNRAKLRPFMAEKKVFIIKNVENLTLDGANAFLKTLEEPAADSLLILTTSAPERILDTIKSRCHMIHFPLMADDDLALKIREGHGVDQDRSRLFAYFAQGSLAKAQKLCEGRFAERKNEMIDEFILNRPPEARIKELVADKEATKEFLDTLLSWVRDALLAKAGVEDRRLVHLDRLKELARFEKNYTFEELNVLNQSIIKMCRLLADRLNIKLPLLIIGEQLWGR